MALVIDYKGILASLSQTRPEEWLEEVEQLSKEGGSHYLYHHPGRKLTGEVIREKGYFEVAVYGDDMEVSYGAREEDLTHHKTLAPFVASSSPP